MQACNASSVNEPTTWTTIWVRPLDGLAADQARLALELELATTRHDESAAQLWADYKPSYERFRTAPPAAKDEL